MNDSEYENLSTIAHQLESMTFVLKAYCENYEQKISEIANLYEFSLILKEISNKLYDLL